MHTRNHLQLKVNLIRELCFCANTTDSYHPLAKLRWAYELCVVQLAIVRISMRVITRPLEEELLHNIILLGGGGGAMPLSLTDSPVSSCLLTCT